MTAGYESLHTGLFRPSRDSGFLSDEATVMSRRRRGRSVRVTPRIQEILDEQRRRFVTKFHREPGPDDPIFFDPEANEPASISAERFDDFMVAALKLADIRPEFAYAMRKTGLIVTEDNSSLFSKEDLTEWSSAIREYWMSSGKPVAAGGACDNCSHGSCRLIKKFHLFIEAWEIPQHDHCDEDANCEASNHYFIRITSPRGSVEYHESSDETPSLPAAVETASLDAGPEEDGTTNLGWRHRAWRKMLGGAKNFRELRSIEWSR